MISFSTKRPVVPRRSLISTSPLRETVLRYFECLDAEDWRGIRQIWPPDGQSAGAGRSPSRRPGWRTRLEKALRAMTRARGPADACARVRGRGNRPGRGNHSGLRKMGYRPAEELDRARGISHPVPHPFFQLGCWSQKSRPPEGSRGLPSGLTGAKSSTLCDTLAVRRDAPEVPWGRGGGGNIVQVVLTCLLYPSRPVSVDSPLVSIHNPVSDGFALMTALPRRETTGRTQPGVRKVEAASCRRASVVVAASPVARHVYPRADRRSMIETRCRNGGQLRSRTESKLDWSGCVPLHGHQKAH